MIGDIDIYRAAKILIDQHGDTAEIAAAMREDVLFDRGDLDGAAVWWRIKRAVEDLQRTEPDGPVN